jgi:hypothetical protein
MKLVGLAVADKLDVKVEASLIFRVLWHVWTTRAPEIYWNTWVIFHDL